MSSCCSCADAKFACKHQLIYFIVAALLWAYAAATLLIPADFPLGMGNIKDALIEPSLAVLAFNFFFFAGNVVVGALANAKFNACLADNPDAYLPTKLRNAFVACFGFVAFIRSIILIMWVLDYTT